VNDNLYRGDFNEKIKPLTNKMIEMMKAIKHTPPTPEEVRGLLRFIVSEILDENKYMALHRKIEKEYMNERKNIEPKIKWVEQR
jgi:hypothetical protein